MLDMNSTKNILLYSAVFIFGIILGRLSISVAPHNLPVSLVSVERDKGVSQSTISSLQAGEKKSEEVEFRENKHSEKTGHNDLVQEKRKIVEKETQFQDLKHYAQQQSVENYIRNKFENLSDYEVVEFLQNYININDNDIPQGTSAVDFAARLGEIFTNGVESVSATDGERPGLIEFDIATNTEFQAAIPTGEFKPEDKKIYASFNTESYQENKVMVKWYRVDNPKVYVFDKYEINADKSNNFIWLEKPSGWNEGIYGVEIYSMEGNLDLMSYGEYAVVKK